MAPRTVWSDQSVTSVGQASALDCGGGGASRYRRAAVALLPPALSFSFSGYCLPYGHLHPAPQLDWGN